MFSAASLSVSCEAMCLFGPNSFQISSNVNNALFSVEFKFATLSVHVSTSRKTISHHVLFVFKKKPRTCWANLSCSWSCKRSRSIPKTNFKFQWPPKFAQRFFLHASVGIFDDRHQQHAHFGMRSLRNIMVQTESLKIVDIKLLTLTRYHVGPLAWLRTIRSASCCWTRFNCSQDFQILASQCKNIHRTCTTTQCQTPLCKLIHVDNVISIYIQTCK